MDAYLFSILELMVNTNEYLETGDSKICRLMKLSNVSTYYTIGSKNILKVSDGDMTLWYEYLKDNGVEKVKFFSDPKLKFYMTHCANWGIIGYPEIRQDFSRIWKFRFQDSNIEGFKPFGAEHEEKTAECFVFEADEFSEFKKTLESITRIAHKLGWHEFEEIFQSSLDILSGKIDIETALKSQQQFRLPEFYGLEAQRRLCAIGNLTVFSGMGNWADSPIATGYPETQLLFTYGLSVLAHTINYKT